MLKHFQVLLERMLAQPETSVAQVSLLMEAELQQLLVTWNSQASSLGAPEIDLIELFEAQAERTPDRIAVVSEANHVSYAVLSRRADQLASQLRTSGIELEARVGVYLERSPQTLITLLGIWKAGGAYVPFDPTYPPERLAFILEDSQATVMLTQSHLVKRLPVASHQPLIICLDLEGETSAHQPLGAQSALKPSARDSHPSLRPEQLACVVYTSGSTGQPKGVAIPQQQLLNRFDWMWQSFSFKPEDVMVQRTTVNFSVSLWEMLGGVLQGVRTIIVPDTVAKDIPALLEVLVEEQVTRIVVVPSLLRSLLEAGAREADSLKQLKLWSVCGEVLSPELHQRFRTAFPHAALINQYGASEANDITFFDTRLLDAAWPAAIPIGRPITHMQLYLLDDHLQPVPIGVPGHLYVGNAGLARGYLNQPDLTAERFVPNPFVRLGEEEWQANDVPRRSTARAVPVLRLYKTGDLARYRPDGNLEYLGRRDQQVKIRGMRVELGGIEAGLRQHPHIAQAIVVLRDDRLVAYVITRPEATLAVDEIHRHLKEKLPDYMLPGAFVFLEAFPLTPNGKVNRKALPAPEGERPDLTTTYLAPQTAVEKEIARIWAQLLGLDRVGRHDNFFELGGHSLLATQVISRVRYNFQIELPLRVLFEAPTIAHLAKHIGLAERAAAPPLQPTPRNGELPLSFAQQRLWFLDRLEPNRPVYNVPATLHVKGLFEVNALEWSLNQITRRHETLRTTFKEVDGQPVQVINPVSTITLTTIDLESLRAVERERLAQQLILAEAQQPFDLTQGPLLRTRLIRLAEQDHLLLVTLHHIISDGWSTGILAHELTQLYSAYLTGHPSPLPPLPIQYADFAAWQRDWLQSEGLQRQLAYWQQQLTNAHATLELPTDRPRPAQPSFHGALYTFDLSAELVRSLKTLSQQADATLFMTLLAAFKALLYRYSGQTDLVIGSPIANRTHAEFEGLIGCFVNTLALRTQLEGTLSFREWLARVREVCLDAYAHQDLPFEYLVEQLQPERHLSRNPLFQVMFVLQNAPQAATTLPSLTVQQLDVDNGTSKFDLILTLTETPTGLRGALEYSTDLFEAATIERLLGHFQTLLESGIAHPEQPISELPLLTDAEQQQLLRTWNTTQTAVSSDHCLHHLVEAQAECTPEAVALVWPGTDDRPRQHLTYHVLNERANQLAHHLQSRGIRPETLVGLYLERCPDLIVGMLGILKAGAAYVPMDPGYPSERLAFILEDSQARVVLTQAKLLEQLAGAGRWGLGASEQPLAIVRLDDDWEAISNFQSPIPNPQPPTPSSLAYLIYTSGSTGRPKGVALTHQSAAVFVHWARQVFSPEVLAGVLAATSICFDLSIFELFVPLSVGGTVVLAENALELPALTSERLTLINTVPSAIAEILRQGSLPDSVRVVNLAGEALRGSLVQQIYAVPTVEQVFNLYGPSEDTTYSTFTLINRDDPREPTIGRPIANTQAYILDVHLQPVPIGVTGDLYLSGSGLARGYWERPDLTAEKFIPNPFLEKDEVGRMKDESENPFILPTSSFILYKTGDLARYLPNGNIEFLGRRDHQVKVRGFRIELGEIEAVLNEHPQVRESLVVAQEAARGGKQLVAYLVAAPGAAPTVGELHRYLRKRLPEYMRPAVFVMLERLPLTPNGKVDRRALSTLSARPERSRRMSKGEGPTSGCNRPSADKFVAPRTPIEEMLMGIWVSVLGIEHVGIHDNFFELGGHSLLATQLISRIRRVLQVELPVRTIFEAPTVADLAEQVQASQRKIAIPPVSLAPRTTPLPLSSAQQRLWFLDQLAPGNPFYNMPAALQLSGMLNVPALTQSLNEIVRRHEALRTTFVELAPSWEILPKTLEGLLPEMIEGETNAVNGQPVQVIVPELTLVLPVVDLSELPVIARQAEARRLAGEQAQLAFNLATGPLIRACLLRLTEVEHLLLATIHHINFDGWSLGVVVQELGALYAAFVAGKPSPLPALPLQYADYTLGQRAWLQAEGLEQQLAYWREQLANLPVLELPTDHPRPALPSFRGATHQFILPPALSGRLKRLAQQANMTLFMVLLAAFQVLLYRYTRQTDVPVGTRIAGRTQPEFEGLVGYFVNALVLRTDLSGPLTFRELLKRVREVALGAYAHQELPFEKLVEELQPQRDLSRQPLFQVMFVVQNTPLGELDLAGLTLSPLRLDSGTAKLDLDLSMEETPQGLLGILEYSTDLFEAATIKRMMAHYQILLEGMLAEPDRLITTLPLMTEDERDQVLTGWNQQAWSIPQPQPSLVELFETRVEHTPDHVAAVGVNGPASHSLTYALLNQRGSELAHYLRHLGVGPEVAVGVYLDRSPQTLVALLGILKAGGVYVPLDPSYPATHLAYVIDETQVRVMLTESHHVDQLAGVRDFATHKRESLVTVCLDSDWEAIATIAQGAMTNPPPQTTPDNLACIVYTSGSTGQPKGVAIPQRQLLNRFDWMWRAFPFEKGEVMCQRTTVNFSVSLWELLGGILQGAPTVIVPDNIGRDMSALLETLVDQQVTRLGMVPSLLHSLLEIAERGAWKLPKLKLWSVCGEVLAPELVERFRVAFPAARLINQYGASEANDVAYFDTQAWRSSTMSTIPIGRPIQYMEFYLLDENLEPVPIGVAGQVYVGNPGLARGYLNHAEWTAEKFIPHPFSRGPGTRLYHMGDWARYRAEGTIEYLGRPDQQIKVRGVRVELRGVEQVLRQHPQVAQAVVIARTDRPEAGLQPVNGDSQRILAYIVPRTGGPSLTTGELYRHLKERLPDPMLPSGYLFMEQLPLTPNGKVNRRALPAPESLPPPVEVIYADPETEIERLIATIFQEVLGVKRVNLHQNFFELGGNSLKVIQVHRRLCEALKRNLSITEIFNHPSVRLLAQHVSQEPETPSTTFQAVRERARKQRTAWRRPG